MYRSFQIDRSFLNKYCGLPVTFTGYIYCFVLLPPKCRNRDGVLNVPNSPDTKFNCTGVGEGGVGGRDLRDQTVIVLLTKLLTHIKQGPQKYCETAYSRSGINQMWILKNSKELLEHLKSPAFNHVTSIKSFDFPTLYTTIPHQKLKERLTSIIRNAFIFKNGNRRYKYLVLGHEETYFVKEHSDSKNKYSEDDIIKMLEFLVDNILVVFAGKVFQQTVGIPMGTNCTPLLADIFLYSYEADFIQSLLSTGKKHLASGFNLTYRYIDDVLSINNPEFENYLGQMYPA